MKDGHGDSSVDIATRYRLDGQGFEFRWEAKFSAPSQFGLEAHTDLYTMGTGCLSPGVNRQRRGFDHLPYLAPRLEKD